MEATVEIDGIYIEEERRKIRNLRIEILPHKRVKMYLPMRFSIEKAEKFANSKIDWIKRTLSKQKELPLLTDFESGETVTILGKPYVIITESGNDKVYFDGDRLIISWGGKKSKAKLFDKFMTDLLIEKLNYYLQYWQDKTGLISNGYSLRNMKRCWGTCHVKEKSLIFNTKLAYQNERAISYVVLHELTHIKFSGHDGKFYAFVSHYMPDYKANSKLLIMV